MLYMNMKKILLPSKDVVLVDNDDFDKVKNYTWHIHKYKKKLAYAECHVFEKGKIKKIVYMHRVIMNCNIGDFIDHINMNGLDNRKKNLRVCTKSQNMMNRKKQANNTTGYKGVCLCKDQKRQRKYLVSIAKDGINYNFGRYRTVEEAAYIYDQVAIQLHGEFANTNII